MHPHIHGESTHSPTTNPHTTTMLPVLLYPMQAQREVVKLKQAFRAWHNGLWAQLKLEVILAAACRM